jgi:CheY-like chemotaxis protein
MSKDVLLAVDDEFIILFSIKEELVYHFGDRFIYETAGDGGEALEVIQEERSKGNRIGLVIMDWLMPAMKGDELAAKIDELDPSIPFILISGQLDETVMEKLKSYSGFRGLIPKPWDTHQILSVIEAIYPQ